MLPVTRRERCEDAKTGRPGATFEGEMAVQVRSPSASWCVAAQEQPNNGRERENVEVRYGVSEPESQVVMVSSFVRGARGSHASVVTMARDPSAGEACWWRRIAKIRSEVSLVGAVSELLGK